MNNLVSIVRNKNVIQTKKENQLGEKVGFLKGERRKCRKRSGYARLRVI